MDGRTKLVTAGVAALAVAAGGTGLAMAGGNGGDEADTTEAPVVNAAPERADGREDSKEGRDAPITGSALDQAKAAALENLGEGTVTETEVGDEESLYEVEVTLDDGSETDVQLDRGFNVVGSESDAGESEANGD